MYIFDSSTSTSMWYLPVAVAEVSLVFGGLIAKVSVQIMTMLKVNVIIFLFNFIIIMFICILN